jgi:small subunit ribosomal protein S1
VTSEKINLQGAKGGGATSMAELMAKQKTSLKTFRKSDIVEGTITKLTSGEILVDIGAKTEAVVLEKDKGLLSALLSSLKVGDKVNVSVLNPESDQGNPVVSLRKHLDEKLWGSLEKLKDSDSPMEIQITDVTKGGFLVSTSDGLSGFLPNSQAILSDTPQSFIGKNVKAQVLEVNRALHKIIFSQKKAMGDEDFTKSLKGLKVGDKVEGTVSSVTSFGIFVSLDEAEGFVHLSEISWDKLETAEGFVEPGEKVKAQIIGIDKDSKRVNLSIKRLTKDPFEEKTAQFTPDKKVKGTVKQVTSLGLLLDLGDGVEGLIKKDKVPPTSNYEVGSEVNATVSEVDTKRHRVILTPVLLEKPMGYR